MKGYCCACGQVTDVFPSLEHEGRNKCIKCLEKEILGE